MQINPDLARMTPARAKELLAGDIEGYRLPIIELIERQAAGGISATCCSPMMRRQACISARAARRSALAPPDELFRGRS